MSQSYSHLVSFPDEEERRTFYRAEQLFDDGEYDAAALIWNDLRQLYPFDAMLHFVLGRCRHMQHSLDEAAALYRSVIEMNPQFWQAYYYLAEILTNQGQYLQAVDLLYFLLQRQPDDGGAWTLLGGALSKIGEHNDAVDCCLQALRVNGEDTAAMHNLAFAYGALHEFDQAMQWIDRTLALQPEVPGFHMHRAALLLRTGRYEEGWREWEWRLNKEEFRAVNARTTQAHRWMGEALDGKTLLVWCEQGFGDTIQFSRYLRCVKDLGARVLFECQKELLPVLEGVDGVDVVFERFTECPEPFDYHVPLASLPLHADTTPHTIPSAEGYLRAERFIRCADRFTFHTDRLAIGLAWEGSRLNPANHYRSCAPIDFAPLLGMQHCAFYGLQHDAAGAVPALIDNIGVATMAELAGAIASMDLVITIDTSVAHLAGAMGKEVWLLLSALPDWRWELERETTPWYGSLRIFRQAKLGEWKTAMMEAADALYDRIMNEQPK